MLKYLLSDHLQKKVTETAISDLFIESLSLTMSTSGNSPMTPNQMNNYLSSKIPCSFCSLNEDSSRINHNLYPDTSGWTYQRKYQLAVFSEFCILSILHSDRECYMFLRACWNRYSAFGAFCTHIITAGDRIFEKRPFTKFKH